MFAPNSIFKIKSKPIKRVKESVRCDYYQINLEYIETIPPAKNLSFTQVNDNFSIEIYSDDGPGSFIPTSNS